MMTVHGNKLGPIELTSMLGQGGMGLVWNAHCANCNRPIAVKLLAPHLLPNRGARARFDREAEILGWLNAEGVVRVHDKGEAGDGSPFVVMDRAEGRSLDRFLERKRILTVRQTVSILSPLLQTLAMVHRAGICHRDIKPANIMVRRARAGLKVTLIDFGVAGTSWDSAAIDTQVVGTVRYMSPEQAWKAGVPNPQDDLWSVGVVAYECLTGRMPFDGPTLADVFHALERCTHTRPSHLRKELPPELDVFFARAFNARREDRFTCCTEMRDVLLALPWRDERMPESGPRPCLVQAPYLDDTRVAVDDDTRVALEMDAPYLEDTRVASR
jgi:eukaryotic-like serine/threonine-protein kinase